MKERGDALVTKVISCVMSAIIAMGLMPLPAFAAENNAGQLAAASVAAEPATNTTAINYVDAAGAQQEPIPEFQAVSANDKQWAETDASNGWHVLAESASLANRVEVSGNVNLILCDGATLTASKGVNVPEGASLTIWAQSQGDSMGSLVAQSADKSHAAIGSNGTGASAGSITINGGNVNATACDGGGAAAIGGGENDGCGVITINGGKVTASSDTTGATIGSGSNGKTAGKITISGGEVNAKHGLQTGISTAVIGGGSSSQGVDITINGGSVSAVAENESTGKSTYAIGRRESKNLMDSATLDYNEQKPDISVYAYYGEEIFDNYCGPYGAGVDIKKSFTSDTGDTIQGNWLGYNGNTNKKLNGKTLVASNSWTVKAGAMEHGSIKLDTSRAIAGKDVTLSVEPDAGYRLASGSLKATYVENGEQKEIVPAQDADDPTKFTFTMPKADVTVTASTVQLISIKNTKVVLSKTSFTYNGKVQKPGVKTVTINGKKLVAGTDYSISCPASKAAGTYKVTVTGMGNYTGKTTATYKIAKAANPMKVTTKLAKVSASKLAKKAQTIKTSDAFIVKGAVGKVTFKKVSGAKCITVAKSGQITVKKGTKKGTYAVKVKVAAAGDANRASSTKTVTAKVKVG